MKVIKPFMGSPDGLRSFDFEEGQISPSDLRLSPDLLAVALKEGWIIEEKAIEPPENKAIKTQETKRRKK
jgi:hypothetical protein